MTHTVAARPIRALIIQPDNSYEMRVIQQDIRSLQELVGGGHPEAWSSEHCVLWWNQYEQRELPANAMATYLWWRVCPEMEEQAMLRGPVFVTGPHDEAGDSLPVSDDVIDLYERLEKIRKEEEGA